MSPNHEITESNIFLGLSFTLQDPQFIALHLELTSHEMCREQSLIFKWQFSFSLGNSLGQWFNYPELSV